MTLLVAGLILFLGLHSVAILVPSWRAASIARLGAGPWKGLYSLLSIAGFVLIVVGYGIARASPIVLYQPPSWLRYLAAVLMLPVFPLLFATYLRGRIKTAVKHPLLLATVCWAAAHLITNGALSGVLLFGSFLAWSIADLVSLRHRQPGPIPALPAAKLNDPLAVAFGLALYFAFILWWHVALFGVPPLV